MSGSKWRVAGVLGGMGPMATVDFLAKVISVTPAQRDQDHVPLLVHQVPQIPDRSAAILQASDAPLHAMLAGLRTLARAGADFAVIPCNTAHRWHDELLRRQRLRILHIADATLLELQRRCEVTKRIAVLATRGTHRAGVYEQRLVRACGALCPISERVQTLVDRSIAAVKAGQAAAGTALAREAAERLLDSGAQILILACTELPVALADCDLNEQCVDSTLALARACVVEAMTTQGGLVRPHLP